MNPLVRTLIVGGLVVAGAIVGINVHNASVNELEYDKSRLALRAAYDERAAYVRSIADETRYREELSTAYKWYLAESDGIYNRFPGKKVEDKTLKEMEAQVAAGKMKQPDFVERKEFFDLTKQFFQLFDSGRYNPLFTAVHTGLRFDIVDIRRDVNEGKPGLRIDFTVSGAPRLETVSKQDGKAIATKMTLNFGLTSLDVEYVSEKEVPAKKKGAMPEKERTLVGGGKTGAPTIVVEYPERWIEQFPPQYAVGTWWMDPMPAEATHVKLDFGGEIRSQNGMLPVDYTYEADIRPEWKVKDGEKFEGEERIMQEEEMRRGK